jgi:hypothetical protein
VAVAWWLMADGSTQVAGGPRGAKACPPGSLFLGVGVGVGVERCGGGLLVGLCLK